MRNLPHAALIFAALIAVSGCGRGGAKGQPNQIPLVTAATPLREKVVDWDEFTGRFEASQKVEVRARAGGYLQAVHFRDGQVVHKGQLLFTLDPRPAQAGLAAAQAQAEQARGELARAQSLLAAQAISKEEFESKRAAALVSEAAVRARALDLEFTRVTAPASGVASDRRVDPGNVIAGGSSTSDILTTIVSTNPIHFVFDASEGQFLKYQRQGAGRGSRVEIALQDESQGAWKGVIDFSDNGLDDATGAIRMRAAIPNPQGFLRPGMFGQARIEGSGAYEALLIPDGAVVTEGAQKVAYVVGKDGIVQLRPLTLGPVSGGLRVVRSGLRPDDLVVVKGVQRVKPGQPAKANRVSIERTATATEQGPTTAPPPASMATPAD